MEDRSRVLSQLPELPLDNDFQELKKKGNGIVVTEHPDTIVSPRGEGPTSKRKQDDPSVLSSAMAPYLERVTSFADVPVTDAGVDTLVFLDASEGLVGLFDLLGSTAFTVVQKDLKGNINKVRSRYEADPTKSSTLEELVENEKGEKKRTATEGLMWLMRGLAFTCKALQNAQGNKSEELTLAFSKSYDVTLKSFHNFLVKGVFSVAMKACPYRVDFYAKLAADPDGGPSASQETLNEALDKWLAALDAIVTRIQAFYEKGGYGKGF